MKRGITNNEMSPERADLVLSRRFGPGFWFVLQTISLASERRSQRLIRTIAYLTDNHHLNQLHHENITSI